MTMTLSVVLLVNALFAFVVWPPFMKRISADERATDSDGNRTKFFRVHVILISTALALAVASLAFAIAGIVAASR